jgi:hypothetical protein
MIKLSSYALTTTLLAHAGGLASAQCSDGTISTIDNNLACNYDNFKAGLTNGCTVELFEANHVPAGITPTDYIAELCEYDAPTQFVEIQGTYQKDRRYFAGGGILVDGSDWDIDSARLERFNNNTATNTLIAFPNYLARLQYNNNTGRGENGYPANMNLESSCDLNTVMCCFTDDSKMSSFLDNSDGTTGVCHHELELSPESNHIEEGWSVFPGSETSTHCTGFTWNDGEEELLGNMMYDISLKNTIEKGYVKGVPGAPMCGCVEHMPVVEEASCRTASRGDITYTFTLDADEGVRAENSAAITYDDCKSGSTVIDLAAAYKANQAGDTAKEALIDAHLVGSNGCVDEEARYLREDHFIEPTSKVPSKNTRYLFPDQEAGDKWSDLFVGEGINFLPPGKDLAKTDLEFRTLVENACTESDGQGGTKPRHCIIRRTCASCRSIPHRDIYYKHLTTIPPPQDLNFIDMFMDQFSNNHVGELNVDFAIYSTYQDALDGTNAWTYCRYDHVVGFPAYCGPTGWADQWNSYTIHGHGYANHHGYYVEKP